MAGIYIHIPFCKQKCHYCSFHFSTTFEKYRNRMVKAIFSEIKLSAPSFSNEITSIYFGGGTPSLLKEKELQLILASMKESFNINSQAEITLEANPDDISPEKARLWFSSGINRLSIGIQSFHEHNLTSMNRAHNANEAFQAIKIIKEAGFTNYSVDLMFALPDLNDEQWEANLQQVIDFKVPHLSCYNLTLEEQTALKTWVDKKQLTGVSEQHSVTQFSMAMDMLTEAGYIQYELSNYCLPEMHSQHNSSYWEGASYLGIGPSAHSYINGNRYFNVCNNTQYMKQLEEGSFNREKEELSTANRFNEKVMTRLRTTEGLSVHQIQNEFPNEFKSIQNAVNEQLKQRNIVLNEQFIKLTSKGKFLADQVAMELFVE